MTDQEQLDALKKTTAKLNAKVRALKASIEAMELVLVADKESLRELVGSYRRPGEIFYNRGQVKDLERKIEDGKKPRVIWKEEGPNGVYIVDKVTPRRIAVKQVGHTHCEQFNRDGTPVAKSRYSSHEIDLKATFGDDYNVDD